MRVLAAFASCAAIIATQAQAFVGPVAGRAARRVAPRSTAHRIEAGSAPRASPLRDDAAEVGRDRRSVLEELLAVPTSGVLALLAGGSLLPTSAARAASDEESSGLFRREGKGFAYSFLPPPGFAVGKKPLQTHLDEVNFSREGARGYQYGITVDPVRIDSLKEFGTPEEVAARVVTAEVNRDGVFEVLLFKDPIEDASTGAYEIDYVSDGKRGKKHFVTKIFVQNQKLFALTAQVKEEEYKERVGEIMESAKTFAPIQ